MPEDAASDLAEAIDQNTPDTEASGPDQGDTAESQDSTAEVNWQERYEHLQPEFTRATQEAAQLRQIVEDARAGVPEALEYLGWQSADDEDEDDTDYIDPDERYEQRFDQIESLLQQRAEAELEQELDYAEAEYLDQELTAIAEKEGVEFSDEEINALVVLADQYRDEDGDPDVHAAYAVLSQASEARQQRYIKSKKADQVGVGTAGSEKVNLDTPESRAEVLAAMLEAEEQD